MSHEDHAAVLDEFARALRDLPKWAVAKGFDSWMRSRNRRPSPAEIGIEAGRAIKELTDEIADRRRRAAAPPAPKPPVDRDAAAEILRRAGFTARRLDAVRKSPMARSLDEAVAQPAPQHWSDTAAPDSPEWRALRRAREANQIVKDSLAQQARRAGEADA